MQDSLSSPTKLVLSVCVCVEGSLLGVGDLHGTGGGDSEALQRVFSDSCLGLALKLHEGDVVFSGNQTHLFEPGEPAESRDENGAIHITRKSRSERLTTLQWNWEEGTRSGLKVLNLDVNDEENGHVL